MARMVPRLKLLLRQRHWQTHRTFCDEYDKAAREIDLRLIGTWPSRVQLHRWVSGELRRLPYPDHCRILERMFPGMSAHQLFELVPADQQHDPANGHPATALPASADAIRLITSGGDLVAALMDVVRTAQECLVAVGSRSREPSYLQEIETALANNPGLVHYRILIGPPHSQVLKDHLLRLVELRNPSVDARGRRTLHICILGDPARDYERFFVANEKVAVATLPSIHSPTNFDTGLLFQSPAHANGLLQHGKALYGRRRLESAESINQLEVLQ